MATVVPKKRITTMTAHKRQETFAGYLFMTPALIILLTFLIIPIGATVYFSFTDWNGITTVSQDNAYQFVGFDNYRDILRGGHTEDDGRIVRAATRQRDFFIAVKNTVYYVVGVVPTQTLLALILAVILNQRWIKGKGVFRTAFYFPSITSSVVISIIFMWLFTRGGLVNTSLQELIPGYGRGDFVNWLDDPRGIFHMLLEAVGINRMTLSDWGSRRLFGSTVWEWLSGPSVTMSMIMILNIWATAGTMMIIYLAALQSIPGSVYEAAAIDGANARQVFRRITMPLLRPTTFFVVTLGVIGCFQIFDQVFVISGGGPAKTTYTMAYMVYLNGFERSAMGLAAATAILLFIVIFAFILFQRLFIHERADV